MACFPDFLCSCDRKSALPEHYGQVFLDKNIGLPLLFQGNCDQRVSAVKQTALGEEMIWLRKTP